MILNQIKSCMLKYTIGLLLLLSSTALATNNCCNYFSIEKWYLAGAGSIGWHNDAEFSNNGTTSNYEFDPGWDAILALGLHICQFRLEIEGSYRRNDLDSIVVSKGTCKVFSNADAHVSYWNLMFNGYFDYCLCECFSAYFGAGLGMTRSEFELEVQNISSNNTERKTNQFAWQIMPGLAYAYSCHVTLFAEYRLFSASKVYSVKNNSNDRVYLNNVELGIRLNL